MQAYKSGFLLTPLSRASFARRCCAVDLDKAYGLLMEMADEASEIMMQALCQKRVYDTKSNPRDLVTATDAAVEQMLVSRILKQFPDHKIIAEEGTAGTASLPKLGELPTWIIDPIDGTTNFVHGFPHFCLSVGFYVQRRAELALIHNPMLGHRYSAQRGCGVYFNGRRVQVSGQRDIQQALLYQEWTLNEALIDVNLANTVKLLPVVHGLRGLGSAALDLAHVASGFCDAYYHFGPHIWDFAAGVLMVREAGGVVIDPCGGEFDLHSRRLLAAASPELAQQIVPLLTQLFPQPRDDEQIFKRLMLSCNRGMSKVSQCKEPAAIDMDKCFEVGYECVRLAADQLMMAIKTEREYSSMKHRRDLLTKWDSALEELLITGITKHYPQHKFIAENKKDKLQRKAHSFTDEPTWFIDPIDGTMNFVHGFPYAAISVAFWLRKQPEFAIIWNPLLDQCYTSRRGLGAFMNVVPLRVSQRSNLSEALLMHELGVNLTHRQQKLENVDKVTRKSHALRSLGSTAINMCMVAQGFADAYYEFGCNAWDIAGATLIVQEAGGVVMDPSLKPLDIMSRRVLVAATPKLAEELSKELIQIYTKPRNDEDGSSSPDPPKSDQNDETCPAAK